MPLHQLVYILHFSMNSNGQGLGRGARGVTREIEEVRTHGEQGIFNSTALKERREKSRQAGQQSPDKLTEKSQKIDEMDNEYPDRTAIINCHPFLVLYYYSVTAHVSTTDGSLVPFALLLLLRINTNNQRRQTYIIVSYATHRPSPPTPHLCHSPRTPSSSEVLLFVPTPQKWHCRHTQ